MRFAVACTCLLLSTCVVAQTADLPPRLTGKWVFNRPGGAIIDFFSIDFDGGRAPGTVTGKLTWRGFNCGAKDEPIKATWDGSELKFEATTRANVNAQRINGQCPPEPSQFVLKRKPGEQQFEGEARSGQAVITMTAAP